MNADTDTEKKENPIGSNDINHIENHNLRYDEINKSSSQCSVVIVEHQLTPEDFYKRVRAK